MKTVKLMPVIIVAFLAFQSVQAQTGKDAINGHTKIQTIKVYGECGMCKKRIEQAASTVDGIQSANWNENTKILTVKYDLFKKTAVDNVQKKIASVGHDTDKYPATATAYNNLPDCCHYTRKPVQ